MYTRHLDVPVYEYRDILLDAALYNAVKLSLKRVDDTLRIRLTGLKTLDLILQEDAWIVVDRAFNDVPVIAWNQFERSNELSLHRPVSCELRLFHAHGGILLERILSETESTLKGMLKQQGNHHVLQFPKTD